MFGWGRKLKKEPAAFPAGRIGYAVGDIHGRADVLAVLLDRLEDDAATHRTSEPPIVVFLGDYVDRGPQSREVLDLLLQRPEGFERRFLMGNHEQAMLGFIAQPAENRGWLLHGGRDTLASYGVRPPEPNAPLPDLAEAAQALGAALPQAHRDFLQRLELYAHYGDYVFAHAGVNPERALEEQTEDDLFWIRDKFIESERVLPFVVVHGHTVVEQPFRDDRRIALDTGAYATGKLTAARFSQTEVEFLSATPRRAV